jgi:hypothetical protein
MARLRWLLLLLSESFARLVFVRKVADQSGRFQLLDSRRGQQPRRDGGRAGL